MIKCVMLDLGGTLLDFYNAERYVRIYFKIFRKYGYKTSLNKLRHIRNAEFERLMKENYGNPKRHGKPHILMKRVLQKLGYNVSDKELHRMAHEFIKDISKYYKLYPGTISVLSYLKKHKLKIALISNGTVSYTNRYLRKFRLSKYMNYVVVSEAIGKEKSDLVPFKIVVKRFRLKPKECLMIGDRIDEDMLAKKVGIWTCCATYGPKLPIVGPRIKPHFKISSIRQLPKLIDKINKS